MILEQEIHQVKPFRNDYHKAAVNIIYTGKWMMQFHSDIFKPYHLTIQQYNILHILRGKFPESITVMGIRDRMLDRMSDASRIVEVLRKKGLLERNIRESDRRQMDVLITEKGLQLLSETEIENERMDKHLTTLDDKEIEQLNSLLDKLRH